MANPPEALFDGNDRSASDRSRDTRERLLDAAEQLFTERGFEGTSMRALARAAGASLSAANYHFGSKEALLGATLRRWIEPINQERLEALDRLEANVGDRRLELEEVLECFLRPTLAARAATAAGTQRYRQVAARLYSDPPDRVAELKRELFLPILERFSAALALALPGHRRDEIALRFQLMVGSMIHVIGGHLEAPGEDPHRPLPWSDEDLLRHMVAFAAAGMRAPVHPNARSGEGADRDPAEVGNSRKAPPNREGGAPS